MRLFIYPLLLSFGLIFFLSGLLWSLLVLPLNLAKDSRRILVVLGVFPLLRTFFFPFFVRGGLGLIVEVEVEPLPPMRRQASEASGAPSHYREAIKEFPYSFFPHSQGVFLPLYCPSPYPPLQEEPFIEG